jgi:hypothetical protein
VFRNDLTPSPKKAAGLRAPAMVRRGVLVPGFREVAASSSKYVLSGRQFKIEVNSVGFLFLSEIRPIGQVSPKKRSNNQTGPLGHFGKKQEMITKLTSDLNFRPLRTYLEDRGQIGPEMNA